MNIPLARAAESTDRRLTETLLAIESYQIAILNSADASRDGRCGCFGS